MPLVAILIGGSYGVLHLRRIWRRLWNVVDRRFMDLESQAVRRRETKGCTGATPRRSAHLISHQGPFKNGHNVLSALSSSGNDVSGDQLWSTIYEKMPQSKTGPQTQAPAAAPPSSLGALVPQGSELRLKQPAPIQ